MIDDDLFDTYGICRAHAIRACARCKPWNCPDNVPAAYLSLELETTFHCRCGYNCRTQARLFFGPGFEPKPPERLVAGSYGLPATIFAVAVRLPTRDDAGKVAHVYQLHPKCPRCGEAANEPQES